MPKLGLNAVRSVPFWQFLSALAVLPRCFVCSRVSFRVLTFNSHHFRAKSKVRTSFCLFGPEIFLILG
ncbi:hypothetical protein L596_001956 [Steinernema carpocapsae]|uniref:Uncharacterized protein n=1 Tax=Steinernema carpocapsae TaxID=34508 RepID=A0A4U8UN02_STECR|nr:hypothetical protein L596_001956 [Steinernema carpocapsae]